MKTKTVSFLFCYMFSFACTQQEIPAEQQESALPVASSSGDSGASPEAEQQRKEGPAPSGGTQTAPTASRGSEDVSQQRPQDMNSPPPFGSCQSSEPKGSVKWCLAFANPKCGDEAFREEWASLCASAVNSMTEEEKEAHRKKMEELREKYQDSRL